MTHRTIRLKGDKGVVPQSCRICRVFRVQRRALTAYETLITACLLGVVLLIATVASSWVRGELKRQQAWTLLNTLQRALHNYHAATGDWPGAANDAEARAHVTEDPKWAMGLVLQARQVTSDLTSVSASKEVLRALPSTLILSPAEAMYDQTSIQSSSHTMLLLDPWGQPLGCLTMADPAEEARNAVKANGGCPIFISAGPDQTFGPWDAPAGTDNIFLHPRPEPTSAPATIPSAE